MKLRKWREVWRPIISRAIRCGLLRAPDGVLVASQPPQTHPGGVPNFSDGCARVLPAWAFLVASGTRLWIDHVLRLRYTHICTSTAPALVGSHPPGQGCTQFR